MIWYLLRLQNKKVMDIRYTSSSRPDEKRFRFIRLAKTAYDMIEQCEDQIESFFDWSVIHLNDHKGNLSVTIHTPTDLTINDKDNCSKIIANSWVKMNEYLYDVTYIVVQPK